jgi:hypothetical protein
MKIVFTNRDRFYHRRERDGSVARKEPAVSTITK